MPQRKPLLSSVTNETTKDTKMDIEKVVHEIRTPCKGGIHSLDSSESILEFQKLAAKNAGMLEETNQAITTYFISKQKIFFEKKSLKK